MKARFCLLVVLMFALPVVRADHEDDDEEDEPEEPRLTLEVAKAALKDAMAVFSEPANKKSIRQAIEAAGGE